MFRRLSFNLVLNELFLIDLVFNEFSFYFSCAYARYNELAFFKWSVNLETFRSFSFSCINSLRSL